MGADLYVWRGAGGGIEDVRIFRQNSSLGFKPTASILMVVF